jgi:hypothetical protein
VYGRRQEPVTCPASGSRAVAPWKRSGWGRSAPSRSTRFDQGPRYPADSEGGWLRLHSWRPNPRRAPKVNPVASGARKATTSSVLSSGTGGEDEVGHSGHGASLVERGRFRRRAPQGAEAVTNACREPGQRREVGRRDRRHRKASHAIHPCAEVNRLPTQLELVNLPIGDPAGRRMNLATVGLTFVVPPLAPRMGCGWTPS